MAAQTLSMRGKNTGSIIARRSGSFAANAPKVGSERDYLGDFPSRYSARRALEEWIGRRKATVDAVAMLAAIRVTSERAPLQRPEANRPFARLP